MSAVLREVSKPGLADGIQVTRAAPGQELLLTPAALAFLAGLHRRFDADGYLYIKGGLDRDEGEPRDDPGACRELTGLDPMQSEDRERLGLGLKAYRIIAPRLPK